MAFQIGAGGGLTRDFSAPEFRVVGGFSWTLGREPTRRRFSRSAYDSDGDGVKDAADACPQLPEDRDGFKDADGCPDTDNDADGVKDASDRCPLRAEDVDGFRMTMAVRIRTTIVTDCPTTRTNVPPIRKTRMVSTMQMAARTQLQWS